MIRQISGRLSNAGRDFLQAAIVINSFYINSDPEYNDIKVVHLVLSFVCWRYKLDQNDVFPLLADSGVSYFPRKYLLRRNRSGIAIFSFCLPCLS